MLEFLRAVEDKGHTKLTLEAKRDINWFVKFLPTFNGTTFFTVDQLMCPWNWTPVYRALGPDGVYTITIPIAYKNFNIVHQEMVNILAAIRVWGNQWKHQKVSIACNNEAVVQVLSSGKTRDLTLAAIARNIQFQVALYDIDLKVRHIPGKTNVIADLLSRWALVSQPLKKLQSLLPNHVFLSVNHEYISIDWSI